MRFRFVSENSLSSALIRAREGEIFPFTPSHVELVVPEGYLGARDFAVAGVTAGVQIRPVGYDAKTMLHELIFDVPLPDEAAAEAYARDKIGSPYDWAAIVDYVAPLNMHGIGHLICSAFATMVLRHGKFFTHPLAARAHAIDPRDVLLLISAQMPIPPN